jgi:hypothetical protein
MLDNQADNRTVILTRSYAKPTNLSGTNLDTLSAVIWMSRINIAGSLECRTLTTMIIK